MGLYTEFIFGASLRKETPRNVIDTLKYMCGLLDEKPNNMAFNYKRNPLSGSSYSFAVSKSLCKMWFDDICKQWIISTRANIKNYDTDIENFIEFIRPYIDSGSGSREMFAIQIHEESNEPTIYYLDSVVA